MREKKEEEVKRASEEGRIEKDRRKERMKEG